MSERNFLPATQLFDVELKRFPCNSYVSLLSWMNSNPSTIITACLLGVGSTLVVLFGTWAYLRHRTRKLKAEHEAEELEANRAKIGKFRIYGCPKAAFSDVPATLFAEAEKDAQEGPLAVTSM
jgi:hypothetical protein